MDINIKSGTSVLFFNGKKLEQKSKYFIPAKADRKIVNFHQFFFITASNYDAQEKEKLSRTIFLISLMLSTKVTKDFHQVVMGSTIFQWDLDT